MFLRRPQLPDLPNPSPTSVFPSAQVLALCVPWTHFTRLAMKLWTLAKKSFCIDVKLLPLFLFFSTTHDQLLKMIIDAESDLKKTRDSLCPQQGGLLKLHNCPLIFCLLERETLHPLLLIV